MKIVAMHTCLKTGGKSQVIQKAPFLAKNIINKTEPKKNQMQFLGDGYYFWDNNIEMAKLWGSTHCTNDYYVVECEIEITQNNCLDLVGNRIHQLWLQEVVKKILLSSNQSRDMWPLGKVIETLKKLAKLNQDAFPFIYIRAIDYLTPNGYEPTKLFFVKRNKHYTYLNPKISLCAIPSVDFLGKSRNIIYES